MAGHSVLFCIVEADELVYSTAQAVSEGALLLFYRDLYFHLVTS